MFKIETYITPIILSYVDKYIKNFRPEDSQVSLWGGDATFHNLDLRLEVLEEELQLPFTFVSGHIHELLIHVPWTKLASEPITITINTIECILELKGDGSPKPTAKGKSSDRHKRHTKTEDVQTPSYYVQHLINKIVSNIRIFCNNLILKYVEEDIVLSMNIKLLTFESANKNWEPAYTDPTQSHVIIRKIIAVNDLTVCLDKRNAAGKIDVYQEPMLYRCSMSMHLLRSYFTSSLKKSSTTRIDIFCNSMEFSMTEQQIPMLLRLLFLLQALQQKQLKSDIDLSRDMSDGNTEIADNQSGQTLAGWAWSKMPSILPTNWDIDWDKLQDAPQTGHITHFSFYVDNAAITFKVSEASNEKSNLYTPKKIKYWPLLTFRLQGIFMESISINKEWSQAGMGVSQMLLFPIGQCSCSVQDVLDNQPASEYLKAGSVSQMHKTQSLFDVQADENNEKVRVYNKDWDKHLEMNTEDVLLERSPAFAMDYIYQLVVPDDVTSENLSEMESDLEYSNLCEKALLRLVLGPLHLKICSGLLHRISSLKAAASTYDYVPYDIPKPEPDLADLQPPAADDYDALNENIPKRVVQITILAPVIEFQLMDHPFFDASKGYYYKKRKKISSISITSTTVDLPRFTFQCQCIDFRMTNPMYTKRLLGTTCQLPDPPKHMFEACYSDLSLKLLAFSSRLIVNNKQFTILTPSNASYQSRNIIMPQYWVNPDVLHQEFFFESEGITITGTNPKIVIVSQIIDKLLKMDCEDSNSTVICSSLMQDAVKDTGFVYLEVCIESIYFKKIQTVSTYTINATLGSIKAFVFESIPVKKDFNPQLEISHIPMTYFPSDIQQVLVFSGPEYKDDYKNPQSTDEQPLFTATIQLPLHPEVQNHPPIIFFIMREVRMCCDPLMCKWLLYAPRNVPPKTEMIFESAHRKLSRSYSDVSAYETPRRARTPYESIHSSLDQSTLPPKVVSSVSKDEESVADWQEQTYNFLKNWFDVWKGLLIFGDISSCTIYFPVKSLSAVGSQGIQEAVEEALKKENPLDILVISLPPATIRTASYKENISKYLYSLPVILPENIWSKSKCSFPWSFVVPDLSCFTWQNGEKFSCLDPVSLTATVGLSTKSDNETQSIDNLSFSTSKEDIQSLGLYIHIDMTPIMISVSELQVCLIASILLGIFDVLTNILPDIPENVKVEPSPMPATNTSTLSPTLLKESTMESLSEKTPYILTEQIDNENVKLTAWIQWTITKFSLELLAHDHREMKDVTYQKQPKLKFVLDAEDIVSSLDFQNVYLMVKSKIGTASIMHFAKENDKWVPGEFLGFVMQVNEEPSTSDRQEDTSFANITITRASCQHTHHLWGTSKKNKTKEMDDKIEFPPKHTRYITEILLSLQPIDILLSPATLKNYFLVLEPLLQISSSSMSKPLQAVDNTIHFSNINLPLTYLEFRGFRLIMPSEQLGKLNLHQNTAVFQIKGINLNPMAVNPICRVPSRPDIYQQAAQSRILNVPGSDVEDRQYQLDVIGISLNTGTWSEISQMLKSRGKNMSMLRTMSENPALEWNNLGKAKLRNSPALDLWPVIANLDISVIAAPAMIYKHDVICGHSVEINFISDIKFTLSLAQIKLMDALMNETTYSIEVLTVNINTRKRPKVVFPYAKYYLGHQDEDGSDTIDLTRDSGIETSEIRSSSFSMKTKESTFLRKMSDVSEKSAYNSVYTSKNLSLSGKNSIPLEVLVTGGNVFFILYEYDSHRNLNTNLRNHYESESERGYEASEEGSCDEKLNVKKFAPLLFIKIAQPNAFLSDTPIATKLQISCYDIGIKIGGSEQKALKGIPNEDDFAINLLETKPGEAHPDTGVLPAFFTLKWSKGVGKPTCLDIDIAKPTKIICSIPRWLYLLRIQEKIMENLEVNRNLIRKEVHLKKIEIQPQPVHKHYDHYSKFKEIKESFYGITQLNINLSQFILAVQTSKNVEVSLSFAKLTNNLTISNRPEKLLDMLKLDCVTICVAKDGDTKLILNPWKVAFEVSVFWECWQSSNSNPQLQVSVDSDCFVLDISPDKIQCIHVLSGELTDFISNFQRLNTTSTPAKVEYKRVPVSEKEQHYKDDLRAGAFQFVDSTSNNTDELPLPYQVMFWNRNLSAMAWRYPQPRALTKVRIFPVPFKMSSGNEEDQQILCHLEYWSDCHGCYQPYTQFYLSETEMCHLDLPRNYPQPAVACTWRVVLTPSIKDYNNTRVLVSPRALAGCIRVDSYFNKSLVPELTVAIHIASLNINFYNYFNKSSSYTMQEDLKNFIPDLFVPEHQQFLSLSIENAKAFLATWAFETAVFDINATTRCTILDYGYLTQEILIEPFSSKLEISLSKTVGINYISKPIHVLFGASAAHTLGVSGQMWAQCFEESTSPELIIMTHYVICNDTNVNLRFGQAGLEDIFLPSRYCHMYAWRSQKCKQTLMVALEENRWIWSEPFKINQDGTEMYKIADHPAAIIVTVKSLSATQKLVIFSGQLILCNTLLEHFEMKILETLERNKEVKVAQSHIIRGKSTPPSMLIDGSKDYFLRLRFFGLESAWSGDIPLMENTKCLQPWLVKVPLQERGQFLSIWCKIIVQNFPKGVKILATLWPLFMIRSNLPISAKVHIETPTLNVHLDSTIRGLGEYQQLYCPGTIDHSHQLTFQLDNITNPRSNPYVPLNYSLVDQKVFFKKPDREDIDEILSVINTYDKFHWPYFKDDNEDIEFAVEEQPLAHVQVRYQNACEHSSALLVELIPWSLLFNTLGCSIAIIVNEKELCRIGHYGVVTPPKLEETFYIGVGIGGTWNLSSPLQLAKSNWSQTFYMPQITGTIPLEGCIKAVVKCDPYVCMVSIISSVMNEIRLLRVSSSHVITSHMSFQIQVICFAVPENQTNQHIPRNIEKHSFTLPPHLNRSNMGMSIIQWYSLGRNPDDNSDFVLYISFSTSNASIWSCPIRIDKGLVRRSVSIQKEEQSIPIILISQEYKGQIFLSVHHDQHPQLLVMNESGTKLFCAQSGGEQAVTLKDSEHFNWLCSVANSQSTYYTMPVIAEKFPDLPQPNYMEYLVFASDPESDPQGFLWSNPINVTNFNDQFVRIPFYGDVKVSIKYSVHTIHVTIESVNQVEISARDIRVRLSMHEMENAQPMSAKRDTEGSDSGTTLTSTYFSADQSRVSIGNENNDFEMVPPIEKHFDQTLCTKSENLTCSCSPKDWRALRILVFIKGLTFTLTSDLENGGVEKTEVASLTCDNISLTVTRTEISQICLSISDLQLDNQLYSRGSYDFPVLLVGQQTRQNNPLKTLNVPIIQLVHTAQNDCLIRVDLNVESWKDVVQNCNITGVRDIKINVEPFSIFIEDVYIMKVLEYVSAVQPSNVIIWPKTKTKLSGKLNSLFVAIPEHLTWGSQLLAKPLILRTFIVEPISILISVHSSIKIYIALDQSPLQFGKFDRKRIFTTNYRLGHSLTMHYLSGAIFGAGWVVGSLELLGSPGGLARAMGTGLRDFISLPYYGLVQGPWAFLWGVSYGSASLMKHVTAGTLQSVTKLASSVARNLDRLTLDEEHLRRAEESRRHRPQGVTQGFMQGLTGLGISLLGAVGGIAHHPLQSVMVEGASPRSLVAGVGKGIVGVITKPLSGAAELVALTGQGLLQGAGWNNLPEPRMVPVLNHIYSTPNALLKYKWKFIQTITQSNILFMIEATAITNISQYTAVALVLTSEALVVVDIEEDMTQRVLSLSELTGINNNDPTLLCLKLDTPKVMAKVEDDEVIEMDPACRARVADYVRSTVGLLQLPDASPEHSDISISPHLSPSASPNGDSNEETLLTFYVNPLGRNYFLCLLSLAKHQLQNFNFSVL